MSPHLRQIPLRLLAAFFHLGVLRLQLWENMWKRVSPSPHHRHPITNIYIIGQKNLTEGVSAI